MKTSISLCTLCWLISLHSYAEAQSTAYSFDLRGAPGLYSHTPSDPVSDWTLVGLRNPETEHDVIAMDSDSAGVLYGVDLDTNILGIIDPTTGGFTNVAPLTGTAPAIVTAMTIDQTTDMAYITDGTALYMMDIATGVCTQIATEFTNTATNLPVVSVFGMATDSAGNFWVFDVSSDSLWELDESNGDCTQLGTFPVALGNPNFSNNGMDWDPVSGQLYHDAYTGGGTGSYGIWDTTTGVFTEVLSHASFGVPSDGSLGGDIACFGGTTFHLDFWSDEFYTYDTPDPNSGNMTNTEQPEANLFAMDFDDSGTFYAINSSGQELGMIDTTTGYFIPLVPLMGDFPVDRTITGMTYDSANDIWYIVNTTSLYTLDIVTGATTFVADFTGAPLGNAPTLVIDVASDTSGNMFVFSSGSDDRLYSVDLTGTVGECTEIGQAPVAAGGFQQGMDFDPADDTLYAAIYVGTGNGLYGSWDTTTGVFTTIIELENLPTDGDLGYELELAIQPEVIEEPVDVFPESITTTRGTFIEGGIAEVSDSDNSDYRISRSTIDTLSRTEFEVKAVSPTETPTLFEVTLEGAVFGRSNVVQTISLFNYTTGVFDVVDSQNANRSPSPDKVVTVSPAGNLADYVEPGTGCVTARVLYQSDNRRQKFTSNTDQFFWTIQ